MVWTYRPDPTPEKALTQSHGGELALTRLGLDRDSFSIGLRIDQGVGARRAAVQPSVVMTVDGCPAAPPKVKGTLTNDGTEGRVVFARSELSRGDLQFVITAFDRETSLYVVSPRRATC